MTFHEAVFCLAPCLLAAPFLPVAAWRRALRRWVFAPLDDALTRVSRLPTPAIYALLFAWGFALAAALWFFVRRPEAHIHDEASYLLAADTFARGRWTNPALPESIAAHFEALHIITKPSYMAKYPPGQGLLLALGIVLSGNPATGLWLNAGAVCASSFYAVLPVVRGKARVALLAAVSVGLHPAVLKWTQSFWGGNLALFAGLLLLGAAWRLVARDSPSPPTPLSLGRTTVVRGERGREGQTLPSPQSRSPFSPTAARSRGWLPRVSRCSP